MRVKPPRRKEWRIDLSSAPIGLLTPINPSLTEQLTTQISNQDPAVYSTSTRSTSFKRNLPRQQSSSTNEDESLKSSENINISNDDHSSEDYIIHEDIVYFIFPYLLIYLFVYLFSFSFFILFFIFFIEKIS